MITFTTKTVHCLKWVIVKNLDVSKKFKTSRVIKSQILVGKIKGEDGSEFSKKVLNIQE